MLAQFYPPIRGGEEHMVRALSTALTRRGHHVAVATILHDGAPEFELDDGVRVYRLRSTSSRIARLYVDSRRHAPPAPDPELVLGLRRVVERERPDVVHAHNWLVHSFLPLKRWADVPLVLSLHDYSLVCANKRLWRYDVPCTGPAPVKCLRCAANHYSSLKGPAIVLALAGSLGPESALVDLFLPVSDSVLRGNGLERHGLPYAVIPNFVEPRDPDAGAGRDGQLRDEGFLLFVGDLTTDKGVHVLLRAFAMLGPRPRLVLIGRGDDALQRLGVPDDVEVLESLHHDGVLEAFRRCSIAVVPSILQEASGLVALEAMSMGKPVVASRTGGLNEIVVDGETGLLVPPGDEPALSAALDRLIGDGPLRERLGKAGQDRVRERYSADVVVPSFERMYAAVADGRPRR